MRVAVCPPEGSVPGSFGIGTEAARHLPLKHGDFVRWTISKPAAGQGTINPTTTPSLHVNYSSVFGAVTETENANHWWPFERSIIGPPNDVKSPEPTLHGSGSSIPIEDRLTYSTPFDAPTTNPANGPWTLGWLQLRHLGTANLTQEQVGAYQHGANRYRFTIHVSLTGIPVALGVPVQPERESGRSALV